MNDDKEEKEKIVIALSKMGEDIEKLARTAYDNNYIGRELFDKLTVAGIKVAGYGIEIKRNL